MGLKLHNTLTRTKQEFVPIDPRNVRMYVCGPTVYDFAHIGNARPLIVFDVLFRLLRHLYGPEHVTYVRNITDVDDKINARAAEEYPGLPLNQAIHAVTEKTERQFHEDVKALGCLDPTFEPRATEYISRPAAPEDMIRLIARLIERGHAYVEQGNVMFDVPSMEDYGRLSNRPLDDMIAGARVEVASYKRDPMDFVLWKPSKPGEPAWPSPWGMGRPGWHIECSAMAGALLGPVFDIHGGGLDLIFPHHENEIAQSRCAHGTNVMANYWLHNGFLQVEGEKMSKSLGNFVTIRDLHSSQMFGGRSWAGGVLRLAMLMTHYREPVDFTASRLEEAERTWRRWGRIEKAFGEKDWQSLNLLKSNPVPQADVLDALSDDLNTHGAIVTLQTLARSAEAGHEQAIRALIGTAEFLGLDLVEAVLLENAPDVEKAVIADHIAARAAARKAKNFAEADRIRQELDAMGIALKDSKDPKTGELVTTWEVKR